MRTATYDKQGRMNYNPDYHPAHRKPWLQSDQRFLIDNYDVIGPEQVSLAIERTIKTVMNRAYELRRLGLMPDRKYCTSQKRIGPERVLHKESA